MTSPFIVFFAARSGSTALYGDLANHPDVIMRAEVFGNKSLPEDLPQTDDNRIAFLRKYFSVFKDQSEKTSNLKAKGFKVQVTADNAQFERPGRLIKVLQEYGTKIIILRRAGLIEQCISAQNAKRLKEASALLGRHPSAHVKAGDEEVLKRLNEEKMVIDIEQLRNSLMNLKKTYAKLEQIAAKFPEKLELQYEDYASDRAAVIAKVAKFIGVDEGKFEQTPAFTKITDSDLSKVVKNYDALVKFASNQKLPLGGT